MDLASFQNLLQQCQTEQDTQKRKEVEDFYFKYKQEEPASYVANIIEVICSNSSSSNYAAILFRRDMEQSGDVAAVYRAGNGNPECVHEVMVRILNTMLGQTSSNSIRFLSEILGVHLERILESDPQGGVAQFPEFFQALETHFAAPTTTSQLRVGFLNCIKYICGLAYTSVTKIGGKAIIDLIFAGLEDQADTVAVAAIKCVNALILYGDSDDEDEKNDSVIPNSVLQQFVYKIIQRLPAMIGRHNFMDAEQALEQLVDIADMNGAVLKPMVKDVHILVTGILSPPEIDDSLKRLTIVLFSYLCENISDIRKRAKKAISEIISQFIFPYCGLFDDTLTQAWLTSEDPHHFDDQNSLLGYAESALDRISTTLGYKVIFPLIKDFVSYAKANPTVHNCFAVANIFTITAEGLARLVTKEDIVFTIDTLLELSNHPHQRVRYSVLSAIGQLSEDYAPTFQTFHEKVMPLLTKMAQDPCIAVAAHSLGALVNFLEHLKKAETYLYKDALEPVITMHLMQSNHLLSNTNSLALVASLSNTLLKNDFADMCKNYIPHILGMFTNVMETLRKSPNMSLNKPRLSYISRILECLSIVAGTLPQLFAPHIDPLLTAIMELFNFSIDDAESSLLKYTLIAVSRIVDIYPETFPKYMDPIIAKLNDIFNLKYIEFDNVNEFAVTDDDDCSFTISPHVLQLQAIGFDVISGIMRKTPAAFAPHLDAFLTKIQDRSFHTGSISESLKLNSIECICTAFRVAVAAPTVASPPAVHQRAFTMLIAATESNIDDIDIYQSIADSMAEYVMDYCKYITSTKDMTSYTETVNKVFSLLENFEDQCRKLLEVSIQDLECDDDLDPEETATMVSDTVDDFSDAIATFADVYGTFAEALGDLSLDFMSPLLMPVIKRWVNYYTSTKKNGISGAQVAFLTSAVSILADIVKYLSPANSKSLVEPFVTIIIENTKLNKEWVEINQVCCYTAGLLFEKYEGDPGLAILIPTLLANATELIGVVKSGELVSKEALAAYDNAVTLSARMAQAFPTELGNMSGGLTQFWASWLDLASTVQTDREEVIASIQLIISAFARNDPNFMSGNLVHALYAFLSLYFGDHHISIVEDQTNANLIEGANTVLTQIAGHGTILADTIAKCSEYVQKTYSLYTSVRQ